MPHFDAFDGTRLHYTDTGDGLPILCLAGLTRNGTDFDYAAPHLSDVRMIRLDYRGRGASAWADPATYTVPIEGQDAVALLDHLGLARAAVLGTSRGGLIAMLLAATVRDRVIGACLNDIGPVIAPQGLEVIRAYIGKNPAAKTYDDVAMAMASRMAGFEGVPDSRWKEEAHKHFLPDGDGLKINYDPELARAFEAAETQADALPPDFWPFFEAFAGLPLATIRGANSDLLSPETFAEMQRRRPDMIAAEVPGRGHIPFLDEPEAVAALRRWVVACQSA